MIHGYMLTPVKMILIYPGMIYYLHLYIYSPLVIMLYTQFFLEGSRLLILYLYCIMYNLCCSMYLVGSGSDYLSFLQVLGIPSLEPRMTWDRVSKAHGKSQGSSRYPCNSRGSHNYFVEEIQAVILPHIPLCIRDVLLGGPHNGSRL